MSNFLKMFEQRQWDDDVKSFARWKEFLSTARTPKVIEHIKERLADLQARWPNHKLGD